MSVQVHVLLNTCKQNITSMSRLVGTTVANTKQKDIGPESFNMHNALKCYTCKCNSTNDIWERSGSVVECLTRDRRAAGLSLTGVTALWS